jgi:hypothetical protein
MRVRWSGHAARQGENTRFVLKGRYTGPLMTGLGVGLLLLGCYATYGIWSLEWKFVRSDGWRHLLGEPTSYVAMFGLLLGAILVVKGQQTSRFPSRYLLYSPHRGTISLFEGRTCVHDMQVEDLKDFVLNQGVSVHVSQESHGHRYNSSQIWRLSVPNLPCVLATSFHGPGLQGEMEALGAFWGRDVAPSTADRLFAAHQDQAPDTEAP